MATLARIAIVGGGVVGSVLGRAWRAAGYRITGVASRTRASAERAARFIADGAEPPAVTTHPERVVADADVVIVAVPDGALADVATALAGAEASWQGVCVAHCAGAWPADVLQPCAAHGALLGGLHPLLAFAAPTEALAQLPGTVFGVEGDAEVQARLAPLVTAIGGRVWAIRPGTKVAYHAAAAVISNYTTVLADAAAELMALTGADHAAALEALLPLLTGTVANLRTVGLPQALTGPIARGDVDTVRAHLELLRAQAPTVYPLYVVAGRRAVQVAVAKGTCSATAADVLRTMLARTEA